MSELHNIRERLAKVAIATPPEQAGIYQQQRDDIRYLLRVVVEQENEILSLGGGNAA